MAIQCDPQRLVGLLHELVDVDSTVGYYPEIHAWLRKRLADMGYQMTVDNKATAYVRVPGRDHTKTVCMGAHLDTIGLIVRGLNDDGTLRVRQLGGVNYHSLRGRPAAFTAGTVAWWTARSSATTTPCTFSKTRAPFRATRTTCPSRWWRT